jgi:hypothetical protein
MDSRNMERKVITFLRLGSTKSGITFLMKGKLGGKVVPLRSHGIDFPLSIPSINYENFGQQYPCPNFLLPKIGVLLNFYDS